MPAATSFLLLASATASPTALARAAAGISAVSASYAFTSRYFCGPSSGMYSGSSGESAARASASATSACKAESVLPPCALRVAEAEAFRLPFQAITVMAVESEVPLVVGEFRANRKWDLRPATTLTWISGTVANDNIFLVSCWASSRVIQKLSCNGRVSQRLSAAESSPAARRNRLHLLAAPAADFKRRPSGATGTGESRQNLLTISFLC